jgi:hypothetical protein
VKVEAAYMGRLQRPAADDRPAGRDPGAVRGPIAAFGAYVGDPDAEESLFFERVLG